VIEYETKKPHGRGRMELSEEAVRRMKECLGETPDPRRQWGYIRHKLIDLLVIGLCSIITRGKGLRKWRRWAGTGRSGFGNFWSFPTAYRTRTRFAGFLNG
jgi:hypothetical protein